MFNWRFLVKLSSIIKTWVVWWESWWGYEFRRNDEGNKKNGVQYVFIFNNKLNRPYFRISQFEFNELFIHQHWNKMFEMTHKNVIMKELRNVSIWSIQCIQNTFILFFFSMASSHHLWHTYYWCIFSINDDVRSPEKYIHFHGDKIYARNRLAMRQRTKMLTHKFAFHEVNQLIVNA